MCIKWKTVYNSLRTYCIIVTVQYILGDPGADRGAGGKLGRAENDGGGGGGGEKRKTGEDCSFPLPSSRPLRRRRFLLAPVFRLPHDLPLGLRGWVDYGSDKIFKLAGKIITSPQPVPKHIG